MSRYMTNSGVRCSILTMDTGLTEADIERCAGIDVLTCPCLWQRFFVPKGCLGRIKDSVERADIVHLMGHWTILNVLAYFYIRRMGKHYVVCPAGSLPIYGRSRLVKRLFNALFGNRMMRNADYCIACTEGDKHHISDTGVSEDRVVVIPNGVSMENGEDTDTAEFRKKYGLGNSRILLFMGRLNHIKGPDMLLHAFSNLREYLVDYKLVFAGPDGGMLSEMEAFVEEQGIGDRVRFVGYLGEVEKNQAYRAAELLILPSRQEPMSIVVLEAGRAGTPVMVTDKCDFNEVELIGGGVVVGASASGLEEGLKKVLGNREKLEGMGARLKQHVKEHFSWDVIVKRYLELYGRILNAR